MAGSSGASGEDISASASQSSSSATGAMKFGTVNIWTGAGGGSGGVSVWLIVGALVFVIWFFNHKKP